MSHVADFLTPLDLQKISNLQVVARQVVEGFCSGLHRSPHKGFSVEFKQHRQYVPGDEIRHIDWRAFGRSDRFYIREYEEETNLRATLLLDLSGSMNYGRNGVTKYQYATRLAACLTYLVHKQRDRVGLATFDHAVVDHVPPSAKHLDVVLHTLDRAAAERPGDIGPPLKKLAEHFGRRGIVVVVSDFYAEPDAIFEAVTPIRFRGNDVILFHVLDPAEVEFPFTDPSAFEDIESGDQLPVVPDAFGDKYRALIKAHVAELSSRATTQRMDYMLLQTSMPLDYALFQYLSIRDRLTRTR